MVIWTTSVGGATWAASDDTESDDAAAVAASIDAAIADARRISLETSMGESYAP